MSYIQKVKIGTKKINEMIENVSIFLEKKNSVYFHIANLNPEIFVLAAKSNFYRKIINSADEILIDGIGVWLLAKIVGTNIGEKLAGTDFMNKLIDIAAKKRKRVFFLGGFRNSAEKTAQFFQKKYPSLKIMTSSGTDNIEMETKNEKLEVLALIDKFRPDFLFVAYGPPWQEQWIYGNRKKLNGAICMGVGGSFNFFSSRTPRAPKWVIKHNLEWLWRFIFEPNRYITKLPNYIRFSLLLLRVSINRLL